VHAGHCTHPQGGVQNMVIQKLTGIQMVQTDPKPCEPNLKGRACRKPERKGSAGHGASPAVGSTPRFRRACTHQSHKCSQRRAASTGQCSDRRLTWGTLCCAEQRVSCFDGTRHTQQVRTLSREGAPATATGRPRGRAGPSGAWCRAARTAAASARRPAAAAAPTWGPGHCRCGTPR